jgi:outer membrane protein assembly factor BamA
VQIPGLGGRRRGALIASTLLVVAAASSTAAAQEPVRSGAAARQGDRAPDRREGSQGADEREERVDARGIRGWLARRMDVLASPAGESEAGGLTTSAGVIVSGSGLAGGVGYRHLNLLGGIGARVEGMVSIRRYQEYRAAIGVLGEQASTLELDAADTRTAALFNESSPKTPGSALYLDVRYRDYPRHTFYGTGTGSLARDRSDYALTGVSIDGVWQQQFAPSLGVSFRGGVLDLQLGTGRNGSIVNFDERFAPALVPGAVDPPRFVTLGAGIVYDSRGNPRAPADGVLVGASLRRFEASGSGTLDFARATLDVRGYATPATDRGVLAVRALVSGDSGGRGATPFYLQQSLGGGDTLRGFAAYRFQDQALAHVNVEYRWRAHRYVDIVPFVDAGTVGPALSRLAFASVKTSPGIGVHLRSDRRTLVRLDWARSREGHRIVIGIGPMF